MKASVNGQPGYMSNWINYGRYAGKRDRRCSMKVASIEPLILCEAFHNWGRFAVL